MLFLLLFSQTKLNFLFTSVLCAPPHGPPDLLIQLHKKEKESVLAPRKFSLDPQKQSEEDTAPVATATMITRNDDQISVSRSSSACPAAAGSSKGTM